MIEFVPALIYILVGAIITYFFISSLSYKGWHRVETAITVFAGWPFFVALILIYQIVKMINILRGKDAKIPLETIRPVQQDRFRH